MLSRLKTHPQAIARALNQLAWQSPRIHRVVRPIIVLAAGGALSIAAALAGADGAVSAAVIPIHSGVNNINLLGNGTQAMAVMGWRDNGNAHGFDVVTLYVKADADSGRPAAWQIVPVLAPPQNVKEQMFDEHDVITVSGGADCLLHDFRLMEPTGSRPAQLIVAERAFGETFADAEPVTFNTYVLVGGPELAMGWPQYYFKWVKKQVSRQAYCSVGLAFEKELHLGGYRDPVDQHWDQEIPR